MESIGFPLKGDPFPWLLAEENPSVRYLTLAELMAVPQDKRAIEARKAIMERGAVPRILAKQKKGGYWGEQDDFYIRAKYRGTTWQLIILAELGAEGNDERVRKAVEFMLRISQDRESGGFAYRGSLGRGGQHSGVIPCLTGNMVWSMIRLGYLDDPRVERGIDWLTRYQRFDDGIAQAPKGWPYERWANCWGKHTCHMGVVKTLKALAEIPEKRRSLEVRLTIKHAVEYLLQHHVYKRSHDLSKIAKPKWLKLGFPTMWDSDALEILGLLTQLGYRDPRMQEAVDLVFSKQDEQSRWVLENTFNGRFQVDIEEKGKPSRWVTLKALKALKQFYA